MESHSFAADVQQLLDLVTHSLYSDREVFLRELVSNASDALDRARFEGLQSELTPAGHDPAGIRISVDEDARTITVSDDGIGLTADEAIENLGTIAYSGTKRFAQAIKEAGESAEGLVGQFGVGFYASFMVAEKVVVRSRSGRPGAEPIEWVCEGGEGYRIGPGTREHRGTDVVLHLRDDAKEYLDPDKLRDIIRRHSDFVAWPVFVEDERANQKEALWRRNPSEVEDEEYTAFYKHISSDWQEPLLHLHVRSDAPLQFNAVLFVPRKRSWDLDRLDYKVGISLFQKRVKVLDHADMLVPRFLRFVRGVVDSDDVQLNVSREMLQQTPVIHRIRTQLAKKVLQRLTELSRTDPEAYAGFWNEMGHILKEGIHEGATGVGDGTWKDRIVPLLRYRTTTSGSELRSLAEVKNDLPEGDDRAIWYYTSVDKEHIAESPVLEGFRKRGVEVLLMDDPVDEWVVMHLPEFDGVPLKSVARGEAPADEDARDPIAKAARNQAKPLVGWLKDLLGGEVVDVRVSNRLTDSPSVLVDAEGGMGSNLERILKAANQEVPIGSRRVLEINAEHPMVKTLARLNAEGAPDLEPFARLLYDHAAIAEGRLDDPAGFTKRLSTLMQKAAEGMSPAKAEPSGDPSEAALASETHPDASEVLEPDVIEPDA